MLMPRPAASQYRTTAQAKTCQLNRNSAATAPKWNSTITMLIGQLTRWPLDILAMIVLTLLSLIFDALRSVPACKTFVRSDLKRIALIDASAVALLYRQMRGPLDVMAFWNSLPDLVN